MSGPGFTQRPEIPEDRSRPRYHKPWVTWKADGYRRWLKKRERLVLIIDGRRGPIGKPNRERARAAYLRRRRLQGKDKR